MQNLDLKDHSSSNLSISSQQLASKQREPSFIMALLYALPALSLAVMTLPFFVIVPEFYSKDVGLPLATVGFVLLIVRCVDAISDPLIGFWCDRTRPAFGRRRLWVLLSMPLVVLSTYFVFIPPQNASAIYLLLSGAGLSIAWTALQVPYLAWGAELSPSYHGRTRVAALREGITVAGTLLALVAPALLAIYGWGDSKTVMRVYAGFVAVLLPICVIFLVIYVAEPAGSTMNNAPNNIASNTRFPVIRLFWEHASFKRLTLAFLINGFANGLPATLFLLFVADVLGNRDAAGSLLVLYFMSGILGVPFWFWLSKRIGKVQAWRCGMLLATVSFMGAVFLGSGNITAFAVVCVLTGLALGADYVLPASLQADLIEADQRENGVARAGQFLGIWTFASKLAFAGAVGFAFPLLSLSGYDPALNMKTEGGIMMLSLLYAACPILLKLCAIYLMGQFKEEAS